MLQQQNAQVAHYQAPKLQAQSPEEQHSVYQMPPPQYVLAAPNNNYPNFLMSNAPMFEVSAPIMPPAPAKLVNATKPEVNLSKQDLIKLLLTQLAKADIEA